MIAAGVLDSTQGASGAFALTGANRVAQLGVFTMPGGTLALADTQALGVIGPVAVSALSLVAPAITLNGDIAAQSVDLATSGGALVQTGGSLSTGLLTSQRGVAGTVSLTGPNQIAALGAFSAQGAMMLNDTTGLEVAGAVAAPAGLALTIAGNLTEGGQGSIVTSMLSGQAASVQLTQAGNAIGVLDFATPGGVFSLDNGQSLTVNALSGSGASLTVAGDLTLAGPISEAGATVALNVSGAVSQAGGTLAAGLLQGSASSIALPGSNSVAALGNITAPGGLSLANRSALAVARRGAGGSDRPVGGGWRHHRAGRGADHQPAGQQRRHRGRRVC